MTTLRVPATVASLATVAEFVGRAVAAAGLTEKDAYRLRLATDELVTNVIMHGYPVGGAEEIELHATVGHGRVLLLMEDSAAEFDPTRQQHRVPSVDPDDMRVGGFGLVLARMSADRLSYERIGDRNRTIIIVRRSDRALIDHEDR
ncbi:ATP-binding protein [Streptosporangium soli]|nr:ATP-binding protein [Streptosporangium sp. KLBMP 9127]